MNGRSTLGSLLKAQTQLQNASKCPTCGKPRVVVAQSTRTRVGGGSTTLERRECDCPKAEAHS